MWRAILVAALAVGCVSVEPVSGHYRFDPTVGKALDSDFERAEARCVKRYGAEPDLTGPAYADWFTRTKSCMRLQGWEFVPDS